MAGEQAERSGAPQWWAANTGLGAGAAALLGVLLALLAFDFSAGPSALPAELLAGAVRGLLAALAASLVAARGGGTPGAVLGGALAGVLATPALAALAPHATLLLSAGTGAVVGALVATLSGIARTDVVPAVLMSGFFFLVISSFWLLKSIKKGLFVAHYKTHVFELLGWRLTGAGAEQVAKVANMVVAFAAMTAFTWASRRLEGARLVAVLGGLFAAALGGLAVAIAAAGPLTVWTFYLAGDLFNTVFVTTFFAFLNDSVVPEQARRLYGLIVFGGVLGGAVGSTTVRSLQKTVGDRPLVVVAALACLGMIAIAAAAGARLRRAGRAAPSAPAPAPAGHPALDGARRVLASRYLLAIVALVALYEFCSTTLDYQWTAMQVLRLPDEAAIRAFTADVYTITNWSAMLLQLLVTGAVLRRAGPGAALLVLPGAFLLASAGFLAVPALWTAAALSISDNSLNYSINQSARESLWVPTSHLDKYRAKAFIDMFVQRAAKAAAVGLAIAFDLLGPGRARWLSLPVLALLAAWIVAARHAGREFACRSAGK